MLSSSSQIVPFFILFSTFKHTTNIDFKPFLRTYQPELLPQRKRKPSKNHYFLPIIIKQYTNNPYFDNTYLN